MKTHMVDIYEGEYSSYKVFVNAEDEDQAKEMAMGWYKETEGENPKAFVSSVDILDTETLGVTHNEWLGI
jgi:hypothetical protein